MVDAPLPSTLTLPCVEESCQFAADDVEGFTAHFREAKHRSAAPPRARRPTHALGPPPRASAQHGFVVVRDVLSAAELAAARDELWRSPSLLDADAPAHAAVAAVAAGTDAPFGGDPDAWPRWDDDLPDRTKDPVLDLATPSTNSLHAALARARLEDGFGVSSFHLKGLDVAVVVADDNSQSPGLLVLSQGQRIEV